MNILISGKKRIVWYIRHECTWKISLKKPFNFPQTSLRKLLTINHINICIALRISGAL